MHAVGKTDDAGGSDGELARLGTTGAALHTDDVTTAEMRVKLSELSLIEIRLSKDLDLGLITLEIDEDKMVSGTTDSDHAAGQGDSLVLEECVVRSLFQILSAELVDAVSSREFVRVRVDVLVSQGLNKVLAILSVLGWVLLFFIKCSSQVLLLGLVSLSSGLGLSLSSFLCGLLSGLGLVLTLLLALLEFTKR